LFDSKEEAVEEALSLEKAMPSVSGHAVPVHSKLLLEYDMSG